jgi:hypothetical protein
VGLNCPDNGSQLKIVVGVRMYVCVFLCCAVVCRQRLCEGSIPLPSSPTKSLKDFAGEATLDHDRSESLVDIITIQFNSVQFSVLHQQPSGQLRLEHRKGNNNSLILDFLKSFLLSC